MRKAGFSMKQIFNRLGRKMATVLGIGPSNLTKESISIVTDLNNCEQRQNFHNMVD